MSITDIGANSVDDQDNDGDYDEDYERFDVAGMTYVKNHPTTAVGGTVRVLRYFPGDPDNDNLDRGIAGAVLDDPFLYTDDEKLEENVILDEDDSNELRVLDLSDDNTKVLTPSGPKHWIQEQDEIDIELDEAMGVDFEGNSIYGDIQDEFEIDTIILKLDGNAGRSATCCLDVNGAGSGGVITNDDGEPVINEDHGFPEYNGALLERWDGDDDDWVPPRFIRDTQLRDDMEGEQIIYMLQRMSEIKDDYDGNSYWSTVLTTDDEGEFTEKLTPTDEFEADENLVRETKWMEWSYPSRERIGELRAIQGVTGFDDDIEVPDPDDVETDEADSDAEADAPTPTN